VLGSKATGEPATHMAVSAVLAVKKALEAAKADVLKKDPTDWFTISKFMDSVCMFDNDYLSVFYHTHVHNTINYVLGAKRKKELFQ
jgi:hypothetical protein